MGHTYLSPQDGLKGPADPVVAGMGREICTYFGRQEIHPPPTAGFSQPSICVEQLSRRETFALDVCSWAGSTAVLYYNGNASG